MKFYNIQMAAQISGLSTHTIRAWEKRYEALKPDRSTTGRRQYSDQDIERLGLLSRLTGLGNSIGQIARLSDDELKNGLEEISRKKGQNQEVIERNVVKEKIDFEQIHMSLSMGLLGHKMDIINHELTKAKLNLGPKDFALKIVKPFLSEVEARRSAGILTLPQLLGVHAILKFHLGNIIYTHTDDARVTATSKIVLATPEGESNALDIMLSSLLCAENRQSYFFLGPNMPASPLAETILGFEANVILLSLSPNHQMKKSMNDYIEELTATLKPNVEIWLVGKDNGLLGIKNKTHQIKRFETLESLDLALSKL